MKKKKMERWRAHYMRGAGEGDADIIPNPVHKSNLIGEYFAGPQSINVYFTWCTFHR